MHTYVWVGSVCHLRGINYYVLTRWWTSISPTALEEEGLILPDLNASLSSSLLGVQDMVSGPFHSAQSAAELIAVDVDLPSGAVMDVSQWFPVLVMNTQTSKWALDFHQVIGFLVCSKGLASSAVQWSTTFMELSDFVTSFVTLCCDILCHFMMFADMLFAVLTKKHCCRHDWFSDERQLYKLFWSGSHSDSLLNAKEMSVSSCRRIHENNTVIWHHFASMLL